MMAAMPPAPDGPRPDPASTPVRAPAVEVEHLVKRFGGFTAVDDVSFEVAPGELFGFLGPNGAGKTTTISMLCTLLSATAGRARVDGYDITTQRDEVRASIGLVFQDLTLDDYLTAEENLRFHAVMYGVPRSQVADRMMPLLDMVGLTERKAQQVRFFSGGMKRRLEIARGLIHAPRVLFLDEPTIGLDPQTRAHIWDYVDELRCRESTTMFLTTHYMDEAERCDRIAIIDQGRIVTFATADDALAARQLHDAFGAEVVGQNGGLVVRVPDGEEFVPRAFGVLTVGVQSVSVRRPSLDDVFIKYTGRAIRDAEAGAGDQFKMNPMVRGFRRG
jgi:ABC-2 type transport system ATP-binding protein